MCVFVCVVVCVCVCVCLWRHQNDLRGCTNRHNMSSWSLLSASTIFNQQNMQFASKNTYRRRSSCSCCRKYGSASNKASKLVGSIIFKFYFGTAQTQFIGRSKMVDKALRNWKQIMQINRQSSSMTAFSLSFILLERKHTTRAMYDSLATVGIQEMTVSLFYRFIRCRFGWRNPSATVQRQS